MSRSHVNFLRMSQSHLLIGERCLALLLCAVSFGCQLGETVDSRPIEPIMLPRPIAHGPADEQPSKQELFIRERSPVIQEIPVDPDSTGSLFPVDDPRTNLIVVNPLRPGMVLPVRVVANRSNGNDESRQKNRGAKDGQVEDNSKDLIEGLPALEPIESGAAPLKTLRLRLETILPGGDGLASIARQSTRKDEHREIYVRVRIPAEKMVPGADLSTADLVDIVWAEYDGTETTRRESTSWEDEYSLRLSGFEELRSKEAKAVVEQQNALAVEREKLAADKKKIADERTAAAQQRDQLMEKLRTAEATINELQKKVDSKPAAASNAEKKDGEANADDAKK